MTFNNSSANSNIMWGRRGEGGGKNARGFVRGTSGRRCKHTLSLCVY